MGNWNKKKKIKRSAEAGQLCNGTVIKMYATPAANKLVPYSPYEMNPVVGGQWLKRNVSFDLLTRCETIYHRKPTLLINTQQIQKCLCCPLVISSETLEQEKHVDKIQTILFLCCIGHRTRINHSTSTLWIAKEPFITVLFESHTRYATKCCRCCGHSCFYHHYHFLRFVYQP